MKKFEELNDAVDLAEAEKREFVANNPKKSSETISVTQTRRRIYMQVELARNDLKLFKKGIAKSD